MAQRVRIVGAVGNSFTSAKRAARYVSQGRARYVSHHTIELIADDHRTLSAERSQESAAKHCKSPTPDLVYAYRGPVNLRTFAPYPIRDLRTSP